MLPGVWVKGEQIKLMTDVSGGVGGVLAVGPCEGQNGFS